jgi:DMSO/TMAO reductase YedYZ molybdopterin-dependent catalytic subunit
MAEQRKVITNAPENSETPLYDLRSWVTPTPWFFVRNHFDVPEMDARVWRLRIHGLVERSLELTWEELARFPERTVFTTVECAGNGRSFLQPLVHGVQWGAGAVGHAEWTGVPLKNVLQEARIKSEAREVVFEGADRGSEADHPQPMHFARSIPVQKALHPDTLLAVRMNGEPLNPSHGYPVRLLVPGWYGVASVKWLTRIELIDHAFDGYFQSVKYTVQRPGKGGSVTVPVQAMTVKSEIVRPRAGEVLGVGTNRLFGLAWAGEEAVARVEVSLDRGRTWADAELIGPRAAHSWTMWEYLWEVAEPGSYAIQVRAISESGRVQPATHDPLAGGYEIHHSRPIEVHVQAGRHIHAQPADVETLLYDMNAYAEENARFPLDIEMEYTQGEGI